MRNLMKLFQLRDNKEEIHVLGSDDFDLKYKGIDFSSYQMLQLDNHPTSFHQSIKRLRGNLLFYGLLVLTLIGLWSYYQFNGTFQIVFIEDGVLTLMTSNELYFSIFVLLIFIAARNRVQFRIIFIAFKKVFQVLVVVNLIALVYLYIDYQSSLKQQYPRDFYLILCMICSSIFELLLLIEQCRFIELTIQMRLAFNEALYQYILNAHLNAANVNGSVEGPVQSREIRVQSMVGNQMNIVYGHQCTICDEETNLEDKAIQLQCQHIFHGECIREWIKVKQFCPNCRQPII